MITRYQSLYIYAVVFNAVFGKRTSLAFLFSEEGRDNTHALLPKEREREEEEEEGIFTQKQREQRAFFSRGIVCCQK